VLKFIKSVSFVAPAYFWGVAVVEIINGGTFPLLYCVLGLVSFIIFFVVCDTELAIDKAVADSSKGFSIKEQSHLISIGIDPKDPQALEKQFLRTNKFVRQGCNEETVWKIIIESKTEEEYNERLREIGYFDFMLKEAKLEEGKKEETV
jgi:hypothetical protein